MIRINMRYTLESATNLCVIILCVAIGWRIFQGTYRPSPAGVQLPSALRVGTAFATSPALPLDHTRGTLVLALSTRCKFCAASVPFYSHLLAASRSGSQGLPIVAIFPNSQDEVQTFAPKIGSPLQTLAGQDFQNLGIAGTPTLVLVDTAGRIRRVWIGELSSKDEQAVLKTVQTGT